MRCNVWGNAMFWGKRAYKNTDDVKSRTKSPIAKPDTELPSIDIIEPMVIMVKFLLVNMVMIQPYQWFLNLTPHLKHKKHKGCLKHQGFQPTYLLLQAEEMQGVLLTR